MQTKPSAAQQLIGDFAPSFVRLTDDVLSGDIWERPGLSKRDRSLITLAALIAMYRTEQFSPYIKRALDNGVTTDELIETIIQIAFYAGWPNAMTAMIAAKQAVQSSEGRATS